MKKLLLPSILLLGMSAFAQDSTPYLMNLQLKSGEKLQYSVTDIESITFESTKAEAKPVSVAVPTDFSTSWVQKVMFNGKQIAEIDKEYVKAVGKQLVVIYPCGEDGRADLTKGVTTTGASVVWDLDANTATVGAEGEAVSTFYVVDGTIATTCSGEADAATLEPDVIRDNRGLFERNTYKIVKIGTQYWMAENLRTTYFRDGTSIAKIEETDGAAWKANTTGAYIADANTDWVKIAGYLYSGYCVISDKGIAPEGWEVPSVDQYNKLKIAGGNARANYKLEDFGTWSDGMTGTNLNGFSAVGTGTYSGTSITSPFSDTYFWSSTTVSPLFAKEGLGTFRIVGTNKNSSGKDLSVVIYSASGDGHQYTFGHSIRCVRK